MVEKVILDTVVFRQPKESVRQPEYRTTPFPTVLHRSKVFSSFFFDQVDQTCKINLAKRVKEEPKKTEIKKDFNQQLVIGDQEIDEESDRILRNMSEEEITAAQKHLLETLDPKLLKFLQTQGKKKQEMRKK